MFGMVLADEGHRLKNPYTQVHFAVRGVEAPRSWIISATPMKSSVSHSLRPVHESLRSLTVRQAYDFAGLANILWKSHFKSDIAEDQRKELIDLDPLELFSKLDELPCEDPRRLLALQPSKIRGLLDSGSVTPGDLFHVVEDLVVVKRSVSPMFIDQSHAKCVLTHSQELFISPARYVGCWQDYLDARVLSMMVRQQHIIWTLFEGEARISDFSSPSGKVLDYFTPSMAGHHS